MHKNRFLPVLALMLFFYSFVSSSAILSADEIELLDGQVLKGYITSMDEETVHMNTSFGQVIIQREKIRSGRFSRRSTALDEGVLLQLHFNGSYEDTSFNSRKVSATSGLTFGPSRNQEAQEAAFSDGGGEYLTIETDRTLNELQEFTLSMYIQPDSMDKTSYLVAKWNTTTGKKADGKFALSLRAGSLTLFLVDSQGFYHGAGTKSILSAGSWYHITLTFDGSTGRLYIDGTEALQIPEVEGLFKDNNPIRIFTAKAGVEETWSFYNFKGKADDFILLDYALKPEEIGTLTGEVP